MAGFLSGLKKLGLGKLDGVDIYAKEEKKVERKAPTVKPVQEFTEKDFIYDKTFQCPVCDSKFTSKIMKTGKAKVLGADFDFRPRYEGVDAVKYDVVMCPECGYAALSRYYGNLTSGQAKLIRQEISESLDMEDYREETYSYEHALERYTLCLANSVVKKAKTSERAYICLKTAWLLRGYSEELMEDEEANADKIKELNASEEEYLENAMNGFIDARATESFPISGMDESTLDFLLAQLLCHFKRYEESAKIVAGVLTSVATPTHIKDKARDLKERLLVEIRNKH